MCQSHGHTTDVWTSTKCTFTRWKGDKEREAEKQKKNEGGIKVKKQESGSGILTEHNILLHYESAMIKNDVFHPRTLLMNSKQRELSDRWIRCWPSVNTHNFIVWSANPKRDLVRTTKESFHVKHVTVRRFHSRTSSRDCWEFPRGSTNVSKISLILICTRKWPTVQKSNLRLSF